MVHTRVAQIFVVVLSGVALATASCGDSFACTEIGCASGLKLELTSATGAAPATFTATLTWLDENSTRSQTLTCPQNSGAGDCAARVLFLQADSLPETAHLVVETPNAGRFEGDVSLDWSERHRPNGAFCPPECASATVRAVLE